MHLQLHQTERERLASDGGHESTGDFSQTANKGAAFSISMFKKNKQRFKSHFQLVEILKSFQLFSMAFKAFSSVLKIDKFSICFQAVLKTFKALSTTIYNIHQSTPYTITIPLQC